MNKQQFIKAFAEKANFTQKDAGIAFEAMAATIAETLKTGEKIQIAGFGTFETRERAARTGKNPQTGEALNIPACIAPAFKAGKALKEKVNK